MRAPARLLRVLLACLAWLTLLPATAAQIAVVLSDASSPYQEFAEGLRTELRKESAGNEILVMDMDQANARPLGDAALVIGVGVQAAEALVVREFRCPLLLAMVARSHYERLVSSRRDDRRLSAIFIDQPPSRYLDLIRVALPEAERIGMLAGKENKDAVNRLALLGRERKLRMQTELINTEGDIYPAMQRLFPEGGLLLAIPDAGVFNGQTIQNIIMGAYRLHVPMIGYSNLVTKSGALAAVYSTPTQISQQSGELVRTVLTGGTLPTAQYPRLFAVSINHYVARSMGLQIEAEAVIRERMERIERERGQ